MAYYFIDTPQKCVAKILKYLRNHNYTNYHYYDLEPTKIDSLVRIEVFKYPSLAKYEHCLFKYAINGGVIQMEVDIYERLF